MTPGALLVIDAEQGVRDLLSAALSRYALVTVGDGTSALELLGRGAFDVVLADVKAPGADGFEVLRVARACAHRPEVVLTAADATVPGAVKAMREGAYEYLAKPLVAQDVALVVAQALAHARALRGPAAPAREPTAPSGAALPPLHEVVEDARRRVSRGYLVELMREFRGNVTWAAKRAGVTRVSLLRLLKQHQLQAADFRASH